MLASTCSIRRWIEARVKFLSRVHRLEPAAIDGDDRVGEEIELTAQHDELPRACSDRRSVILAEVGDRLEVRRQATGQPHHLDVTLRLALQSAAGLDLVQIAVDVDLQKNAWVIARTARRFRNNPVKPQGTQI